MERELAFSSLKPRGVVTGICADGTRFFLLPIGKPVGRLEQSRFPWAIPSRAFERIVVNNVQLQELGLVSTRAAAVLGLPVTRRSKAGKEIGVRQSFAGGGSASEVKAALKAKGVKGAALTEQVNAVLRGEKSLREQLGSAWFQSQLQSGFVPDFGDVNKAGTSSKLVMIKVKPEAVKAVELSAAEKRAAALKALGLSEDEMATIESLRKA
jgi:hypothetical protein